jgi:hypothetical protein
MDFEGAHHMMHDACQALLKLKKMVLVNPFFHDPTYLAYDAKHPILQFHGAPFSLFGWRGGRRREDTC